MKFNELPVALQAQLMQDRKELKAKGKDTPYEILIYNDNGTRFLSARRHQSEWHDDKGNHMWYGGGSEWRIRYGEIGWHRVKDLMGSGYSVELAEGKLYSKSANGTEIPRTLPTKAEVKELIKAIGIF